MCGSSPDEDFIAVLGRTLECDIERGAFSDARNQVPLRDAMTAGGDIFELLVAGWSQAE
jgi:hypothetical protein